MATMAVSQPKLTLSHDIACLWKPGVTLIRSPAPLWAPPVQKPEEMLKEKFPMEAEGPENAKDPLSLTSGGSLWTKRPSPQPRTFINGLWSPNLTSEDKSFRSHRQWNLASSEWRRSAASLDEKDSLQGDGLWNKKPVPLEMMKTGLWNTPVVPRYELFDRPLPPLPSTRIDSLDDTPFKIRGRPISEYASSVDVPSPRVYA